MNFGGVLGFRELKFGSVCLRLLLIGLELKELDVEVELVGDGMLLLGAEVELVGDEMSNGSVVKGSSDGRMI